MGRQFPCDGKRHADDGGFGCRIGGLADLAVEGGHRRRVDDHAPVAVDRLVAGHAGGGEADGVEGTQQIDPHDALEFLERVWPGAAEDLGGVSDARAVDQDA